MKRLLLAAIAALAIGLPARADFDFRTTGTQSARVWTITCSASVPTVSAAGMSKLFVPCSGIGGYSAGNTYISQNGGAWQLLSSFVGAGAIVSVYGRTGTVTAQSGDYGATLITFTPSGNISASNVGTAITELDAEKMAGASSSVDSEIVLFSGTGGKTAKRATGTGIALVTSGVFSTFSTSAGLAGAVSDETGSGALVFASSPTLTTPTIASFANATHAHVNAAGGGQITDAALSAAVSAAKGGTGISTAASTGVPRVSSGTWSVDAGLSHLAASTSAALAGVISDETGTGAAVFAGSPALTGNPTAPTASAADNDTSIATTAFVQSETLNTTEANALYAPIATTVTTNTSQTVTARKQFSLDINTTTGGANVLTAVKAFGDSHTVGTGASSGALAYASLVSAAKGWTLTNAATTGSQIGDAVQIDAVFAETVTTTSNYFALWGFNDERLYGVGNAAGLSAYKETARAAITWLTIPNDRKVLASQASGSWTSGGAFGSHFTSTNGATKTATVYGRTVYVWYVRRTVGTGTFTITVDGVNYSGTINAFGQAAPTSGYQYAPTLYRLSNLPEGLHTVVMTKTGGDTVYFIAAASPNPALAGLSGPYFFVGNAIRATAAGYAANGGSDANTALFNAALRDVVTDTSNDGGNATYIDACTVYNPNTDGSGDNAHMGDIGHGKVANVFLAGMNSFAQPRDRRPSPIDHTPVSFGENPARSGTINLPSGATIAFRNAGNTADTTITGGSTFSFSAGAMVGFGGTPTAQPVEIIATGTNAAALRLKSQDTGSHTFDVYSTASPQLGGAGRLLVYDVTASRALLDFDPNGHLALPGNATATGVVNGTAGLEVAGQRLQSFEIQFYNNSGTLQARIQTDAESAALPASTFVSKVTGATSTLGNVPVVTSGVNFTNGFGVDGALPNQVIFDVPDQAAVSNLVAQANVTRNSTGAAAPLVEPLVYSKNVNGVTRFRLALGFRNPTSDAAFNVNTTNIPSGTYLVVRVTAWLR